MKKIIASVAALMCTLSMTASATVMEFKMDSTQLNVQGSDGTITTQTLDVAPYTVNDRTVVPVRVISESFGADVAWDGATDTVTITKGETVIKLTIGKATATVNGSEVALDVAPFTQNGRTLVPVRFVTEGLGYKVDYEGLLKTVLITDEAAAMTIGGSDISRATYKMLYDEVSASGYYDSSAECMAMVESILTEMYTFSNGNKLTEVSKEYLEYMLDYAGYLEVNPNTLETVYTQLMIKNAIASESFANMGKNIAPVDDEAIQKNYETNYVTAKHILIPVIDLESGQALSDKDAAAAKKLAQDIKKRITKGEDFDKLMNEYSKDTGLAYYPDGYTFTYGDMMAEFEQSAFALEVGKVSDLVETYYGYHIIKKEPLAPITDEVKQTIKESEEELLVQIYAAGLTQNAEVVKNQEVINSIIGK